MSFVYINSSPKMVGNNSSQMHRHHNIYQTTNMTNRNNKEPFAGISVASPCTRISISSDGNLLDFQPVFTHQCFEEEFIPGWRPLTEAENQSKQVYRSWKEDDKIKHVRADGSNRILMGTLQIDERVLGQMALGLLREQS